ncbi:MAG TPA: SIR2 family protein [Desulfobacteria bacterium]|nr:SIR2 family protein [Desulfobacteria bacterium]
MAELREIGAKEFVRRLKNLMEKDDDCKFAFFIGAGCSVSSGIPAAGALVKRWLPRLKEYKTGDDGNYEKWVTDIYPDYEEDKASLYYGKVIEDLFFTKDERQREIERLTERKDPGFGYAVLAQLTTNEICGRHCNAILTVNFDDLIADAQYLYSHKKPLVIAHEALAGFIRPTRTRPIVIKLHGDARLEPKNTEQETETLAETVKKALKDLLSDTGLIFIGYGGNDKSLAEIFNELPAKALPWGIYWVSDKIPESDIGAWLKERNAVWVKHKDFDELMLLLRNEFGLKHPDDKRFERLLDTYYETFKKLKQKVEAKPDTAERRILEKAAEKAVSEFRSWWAVQLEADKYAETDTEKADEIYREGLKKFPDESKLIGNYAIFLTDIRKDHDKAEEYYKRALDADPNHATNLGSYAIFLTDIRKDHDKAEEYYKRALDADPTNAIRLGNYAGLLLARGKQEEGFSLLQKALSLADEQTPLALECLFYQYAHTKDKKVRDESLAEIKELVQSGVRSLGWNLQNNVKRAVEDGHPDPEFLDKLSRVISEEIELQELEGYDIWSKIS